MSKFGGVIGASLSLNGVFAQTGVKAYTGEDYVTFVFGLLFIAAGAAIIISVLKEKE
jgi:hypothetical protein